MSSKTALFIDGSNLYAACKELGFHIDFKKLLDLYKDEGELLRAYYYTAVMDDDTTNNMKPILDWLDYNGYSLVTKPAKVFTNNDGSSYVKGNMDIEMAVGMLKMARHIDHAVLFTGDGDFVSVVKAMQDEGVRVTVVSTRKTKPSMIADELRRECDTFVEMADLKKDIKKA
jgi:uncharacterized LabA/DUF88 family protein|tara:strand:- start:8214 stop:8729 length:516 start_codon:yes stop_codon:yes gene_type:complete